MVQYSNDTINSKCTVHCMALNIYHPIHPFCSAAARDRTAREAVQRCAQPGRRADQPAPPCGRSDRSVLAHHAEPVGLAAQLEQVPGGTPARRVQRESVCGRVGAGGAADAAAVGQSGGGERR